MNNGKVYLVGAGPGDPELITLKALKLLERADVILYDRLVNKEIMNYAPKTAEVIYVGKEHGKQQVRFLHRSPRFVPPHHGGKNLHSRTQGGCHVSGRTNPEGPLSSQSYEQVNRGGI